jgi:hypothetical protein
MVSAHDLRITKKHEFDNLALLKSIFPFPHHVVILAPVLWHLSDIVGDCKKDQFCIHKECFNNCGKCSKAGFC